MGQGVYTVKNEKNSDRSNAFPHENKTEKSEEDPRMRKEESQSQKTEMNKRKTCPGEKQEVGCGGVLDYPGHPESPSSFSINLHCQVDGLPSPYSPWTCNAT